MIHMRTPRQESVLHALYATLQGRHRPEEVAALVLSLLRHDIDEYTRQRLVVAARGNGRESWMPVEFDAPGLPLQTARVLATLLGDTGDVTFAHTSADELWAFLDSARTRIGMAEGRTSFLRHRANRQMRAAMGLGISRRRYNKLFRLTSRLERECVDYKRQEQLFQLARMAKTAFAARIPFEAFAANRFTAALVAWLTANLGRRSLFTAGKQARAFDEIAGCLLDYCDEAPAAGWFAVAHVFPRTDVLARVSKADRLHLLGVALRTMQETAELLRVAWVRTEINLATMIVRPGNDSSTWNALAGAWNKARDIWIALIQSLGQEATFESFLPGKVMRLMAADVVALHNMFGNTFHPDTRVWAALPHPWDVMSGQATCTRIDIEAACKAAGVNAQTSGWSAPRHRWWSARWQPTPELVHGVTVKDPELAWWLRKVGLFSGKGVKIENLFTTPPPAEMV